MRACILVKVKSAISNEASKEIKEQIKEIRGDAADHITEPIMEEVEDKAMMQMFDFGSDVVRPGLGMAMRFGRFGWKLY